MEDLGHRCHLLRSSLDSTHPKSKHTILLPPSLNGGLAPLQTVFSFFLNDFFWQKRNIHEKWRKPYERTKQELLNGIWIA
jgi:hypothetical protein